MRTAASNLQSRESRLSIHVKSTVAHLDPVIILARHPESLVVRRLCTRACHGDPVEPAIGPVPPLRLRIERVGTELDSAGIALIGADRGRASVSVAGLGTGVSFGRGPTALKRAPGRVRLNCAASRNDAVHGDVSGRALAWPRWISRPQLPITTSFPPLSPNCRAPRRWWRMAGLSASLIGRQGSRPGDRARCSAVSPAAPRS